MQLGIIGLGRMGSRIAARVRRHGHEVVGYDKHPGSRDAASLGELVRRLAAPRTVWLMLPPGAPTEATIMELRGALEPGDVVVDGGASPWQDAVRRGAVLAEAGIRFVDCGTSGGLGAGNDSFCLMVGGDAPTVTHLRPIFEALTEPQGFAHLGPIGAGHFANMVHNGVLAGIMQALGEGYELLASAEVPINTTRAVSVWQHGSPVRGPLVTALAGALAEDPTLAQLRGYTPDSAEGRWMVQEAVRLGVPLPAITAALFARFSSRQEDSPTQKVVASLRPR